MKTAASLSAIQRHIAIHVVQVVDESFFPVLNR